jgi:hypothetical protein
MLDADQPRRSRGRGELHRDKHGDRAERFLSFEQVMSQRNRTASRATKSLARTRADHVSCQSGRGGPPASVSSVAPSDCPSPISETPSTNRSTRTCSRVSCSNSSTAFGVPASADRAFGVPASAGSSLRPVVGTRLAREQAHERNERDETTDCTDDTDGGAEGRSSKTEIRSPKSEGPRTQRGRGLPQSKTWRRAKDPWEF